jgi:hypothetical protein
MRQQTGGWKCHLDERSIADFARNAETGVIGFGQSLGDRQTETASG